MRTSILFLLWAFICCLPSFADIKSNKDEEKTDIILKKETTDDETKHARTPIYMPITCYYMQGNIYLTSFADLGEIQIVITQLETGLLWESFSDSNSGIICIPASSANGNYMIRIITANGDVYYGYYNL